MKKPLLFIAFLSTVACLAQQSDTTLIKQGVIKVRKVPETDEDSSCKHRGIVYCGFFQPFYKPHTLSLGYQKLKYGFMELGYWNLRKGFPTISGIYAESDFKNTHALMLSCSNGILHGKRKFQRTDILRIGLDAGGVRDLGRYDLMFRPFLGVHLNYLQFNVGYNFRLDQDGPQETNKFLLTGRLYLP